MVYLKEPNDFKADAQKSEFTFTLHCTELKDKIEYKALETRA